MIPIAAFPATTRIDGVDGSYPCDVVGIVRGKSGDLEFVVVIEDDGDRFVVQRDVVTAPDGEDRQPH